MAFHTIVVCCRSNVIVTALFLEKWRSAKKQIYIGLERGEVTQVAWVVLGAGASAPIKFLGLSLHARLFFHDIVS